MSNELVVINPNTNRPYSTTSNNEGFYKITPKLEQALVLYATGQVRDSKEAAKLARCSYSRFANLINTPRGQAVVERVRGELDFRYQALYKKFIDVVEEAMDHIEPSVALAGAALFAKTQIGTKHKIELSAEDIVQQLLTGTYQKD